jgi:hypothetical protein
MRLGRIILAVSGAAILGLTATATAASAKTAARPPKPATPETVVLNCLSKPQTKPRDFVLTCADGNAALIKLAWTSWTPALATATGTFTENDCTPDCAAGHFHNYPVIWVLWHPVRYGHDQRFSEDTMIFTGARPLVLNGHKWVPGPVTETGTLWGPLKFGN